MSRQRMGEGGIRGDGSNLRQQGEEGLRVEVPPGAWHCARALSASPACSPSLRSRDHCPHCMDKDALVRSLKISP